MVPFAQWVFGTFCDPHFVSGFFYIFIFKLNYVVQMMLA